jgi:hypothetical protein
MIRILSVISIFIGCILFQSGFAQIQNFQVNGDALTTCNEPSIALNPTNPDNIVIGANNIYYFNSFVGGENWSEGQRFYSMTVSGDPNLAFDLNGNLYFTILSGELPITGRWTDRQNRLIYTDILFIKLVYLEES